MISFKTKRSIKVWFLFCLLKKNYLFHEIKYIYIFKFAKIVKTYLNLFI